MVVLYSEAFYRSREGLKLFRRKELQPPWEIVPKRNYPLPKKVLKFEGGGRLPPNPPQVPIEASRGVSASS